VGVWALIRRGAAKTARLDVEVTLPHGSKATSLRGGHLHKCKLFNYDFADRLTSNSGPNAPRGLLKGHPHVEAEGMLLVGLGAHGDEVASLKHGRIWGGGRCLASHTFSLVLKPDQQYARVAALVGERINETFQAGYRG